MRRRETMTVEGIELPVLTADEVDTAAAAGGVVMLTAVLAGDDEPCQIGYRVRRHQMTQRVTIDDVDTGYLLVGEPWWVAAYCGRYESKSKRSGEHAVATVRRKMIEDEQ
jgi:hypothetical protein